MRTPKTPSLGETRIRQQKWMDQEYIVNVTRNIMGELQITRADLEKYPRAKDFSKHVFQNVLHHIKGWNSSTLGKITAYGLGIGETSGNIPLRRTTLKDVWFGTPLETEANGGLALEWLATTTIVAAVFDLLLTNAFVDHLHKKASEGGRDGCPVADAIQSFDPASKTRPEPDDFTLALIGLGRNSTWAGK